jgi:hypothetical protein
MIDYSQKEIEELPSDWKDQALELIDFCLRQLYRDDKHFITEEFVRGLSFEELTGALVAAREELKDKKEIELELDTIRDSLQG